MKTILPLLFCLMVCQLHADDAPKPNADQSWIALFNGRSLDGWRLYGKPAGTPIGEGWKVVEGVLHKAQGIKGGDIITTAKFSDFELAWEWRLAKGGNNGIKYCVIEGRPSAPGYEYQMLDDLSERYANLPAKAKTASFYDVLAPTQDTPLHPVGAWNASRLVIQGNHVEHWLNGKLVLEYELGSASLKTAVAKSKFKNEPDFGLKTLGHIMLTDHQDEVWYRNIKLRETVAPPTDPASN
jgi:hypothetical protein